MRGEEEPCGWLTTERRYASSTGTRRGCTSRHAPTERLDRGLAVARWGTGPARDDARGGRLRWRYVQNVAAVDLEAEAVPTLVVWINESLDAGEGLDARVRALRPRAESPPHGMHKRRAGIAAGAI